MPSSCSSELALSISVRFVEDLIAKRFLPMRMAIYRVEKSHNYASWATKHWRLELGASGRAMMRKRLARKIPADFALESSQTSEGFWNSPGVLVVQAALMSVWLCRLEMLLRYHDIYGVVLTFRVSTPHPTKLPSQKPRQARPLPTHFDLANDSSTLTMSRCLSLANFITVHDALKLSTVKCLLLSLRPALLKPINFTENSARWDQSLSIWRTLMENHLLELQDTGDW